eukprot:432866_1
MGFPYVILEWVAIVVLVALSGLFSGLNLGLMGLDPVDLECLMCGDEPNSTYAKKIKPLRDCGNWLLCTLLLGNVAVNSCLSILLADKSDALIGFMVSTVVIVIFGEIIPQALCSRYALWIGAHTIHIVWFLMALISFAAYPIAVVLDKILGQELGTIYSPEELKQLINIHAKHDGTAVTTRTANIMKGALDLQQTVIRDVMTKIDDVFWLSLNTKLTFDVLTQIFKSGHSRIPIMNKSDVDKKLRIIGILYAKDLVLLDPDDEIPVSHIMNAFRYKKPIFVSANTRLDQCLKIFVHSRTHLCMVKEGLAIDSATSINKHLSQPALEAPAEYSHEMSEHDPKISYFDAYLQSQKSPAQKQIKNDPVSIGIITLEDVIEHALQTELVDEHDVFINIRSHQQTNRLSRIDWSMLQMFDHRQKYMTNLPPQELQAVYHFLGQTIKVFMPKHRKCSESSIKNLLASSSVVKVMMGDETNDSTEPSTFKSIIHQRDPYKDIEDNGLLLYQRDKKTEYFTLILDGKCEIHAGRQGFRSTLPRWTYLCPDALEHVEQCVLHHKPLLDYVPDFTCKVVEDARVLRIKLSDFKGCIQGQFDRIKNEFTSPPMRGFSEPVLQTYSPMAKKIKKSQDDLVEQTD